MSKPATTETAATLRKKLDSGEMTAEALASATLATISERDKDIQAFLGVYEDVLAQAKAADERIKKGEAKPLTGIPIALKDNILVHGKKASAGSQILKDYTATYDATAVKKLKEQGAVLIGRTNCDEFAMGSSTENSSYQTTKNPHDLTRVPGGSSGGSAAAVAGGMVPLSLGSDTGGSIRQPASFCGVVGLKPTYGSVSRSGLMAMGSSLDVIGPFATSVEDAQTLFEAIKGEDPLDSTTIPDAQYQANAPKEKKHRFIGVPRAFVDQGLDAEVKRVFEETLEAYAQKGYEIVDIDLPYIKHSLATYYVIMPAEVSTNLSRFDGVKFGLYVDGKDLLDDYMKTRAQGFGPEVRRRILLGTYVLSSGYYDAYYGKATSVRKLIRDDFAQAFDSVDLIATPTAPTPAFPFGEKSDPLSMYLADIFTVPLNIAGVPGISIPAGVSKENNLPIGVQLIAPHMHESVLFDAAKDIV